MDTILTYFPNAKITRMAWHHSAVHQTDWACEIRFKNAGRILKVMARGDSPLMALENLKEATARLKDKETDAGRG